MSYKIESRIIQEVEILYRTTRYNDGTHQWHEPYHKRGILKTINSEAGPLKLQTAVLEIEGKAYPISSIATGLDATVVTIQTRGENGWECGLYTSILTEEGKKHGGPGTPTNQKTRRW